MRTIVLCCLLVSLSPPRSASAERSGPSFRQRRAERAYGIAKNASYIPWHFHDWCEARALALSAELTLAGIPSSMVYLQKPGRYKPLTPPGKDGVRWKNHVGVLVDGKMIDPGLCRRPETLKTWMRRAGQPEGVKPWLRIKPGSHSFDGARLAWTGRRVCCEATTDLAKLPKFHGGHMIKSYMNLVWSWAMTGNSTPRIEQLCRRMSSVMNQLTDRGQLDPKASPGRYPPQPGTWPTRWWPAKIELDPATNRYISVTRRTR